MLSKEMYTNSKPKKISEKQGLVNQYTFSQSDTLSYNVASGKHCLFISSGCRFTGNSAVHFWKKSKHNNMYCFSNFQATLIHNMA